MNFDTGVILDGHTCICACSAYSTNGVSLKCCHIHVHVKSYDPDRRRAIENKHSWIKDVYQTKKKENTGQ